MKTNSSEIDLVAMRRELDALQAKLAALEKNGQFNPRTMSVLEDPVITDRRAMLKKVAGLAAGVAAVGLLQPRSSKAANGDPLIIGKQNSGGPSATDLIGSHFTVSSGGSSAALFGHGDARGVAGLALSVNGIGVRGEAHAGASAHAVEGLSNNGVGGLFRGLRAALYLPTPTGAVADPNGSPPTNASSGDIYRGSTSASLWYKAGSGTNPYRRLADSGTAGALTAFAGAARFVNTMSGSGNTYQGQHLNGGTTASYQITGVTVGSSTVPARARVILGRIANPNPTGPGGALLVGATNPPVGGVIAIAAGAPQNSFFLSALDAAGKLYVKNTSASGSTDVIIDIAGFFL